MKTSKRIVVCAQNSDLFEQCVTWLKSFFLGGSAHKGDYAFCFVSVIPQDKTDVCGVMAEGLGLPASLTHTITYLTSKDTGDPAVTRERRLISERAASLMQGGTSEVYIVRHGHGDSVDAITVGETICKFCDDVDASMVVVSQYSSVRGRKDEELRHVYQGSVVEHLLHHCSKPVLIFTH